MKKLILFIALFVSVANLIMSQTSRGFSFQGYARGSSGTSLTNSSLRFKFTIYTNDESNPEFAEEQTSISTDENGIFNAIIGSVNTQQFGNLDFAGNNYTLKVEVYDNNSYQTISKQTLLAVPYAKGSEKSDHATRADSARIAANGVPPGSIMPYMGESAPAGWLICDGRTVSRSTYAALFAVLGTSCGYGDQSTTFNLPDMRGRFMRGWSNGSSNDPDRADRVASAPGGTTGDKIGSKQTDATKRPNTSFTTDSQGSHNHNYNDIFHSEARGPVEVTGGYGSSATDTDNSGYQISRTTENSGAHTHSITGGGDNETRPVNISVNYIIKY